MKPDSTKADTLNVNETLGVYNFPDVNCSQRLLIYECSAETDKCFGLNDRIRGILSSFLLAVVTRRTFVINVIEPCPLSNYYEPNMYDWSKCLATYRNSTDRHYVTYRSKFQNFEFLETLQYDLWEHRSVVITSNVIMFTHLAENPIFKETFKWFLSQPLRSRTGILFYTLFKVKHHLEMDLLDYIDNITNSRTKTLVGIHVRSSYSTASVIQNILKFAQKYRDERKYSIYLATDISSVRKQATALLPNCHMLDTTGVMLHVSNFKATCTSLYYALFDLHILSMSDILLKSQSGFSGLAYKIKRERGKVYIF